MLAIRTRSSSGNGNDTGPDAKQALARMKRDGHAINPQDPDHVRAYIMLRQQMGRIDGASMVQFLGTTMSKTKQNLGGKTELHYWGVPKANFGGTPPADWGECLMQPDQLQTMEAFGGQQVNWNDYFMVDKQIPRQGLGYGVITCTFSASSTFTSSPSTSGSRPPATCGPGEPASGGPVDKCAIVGSTGPASSSTGPASSATGPGSGGPDRAFEVTAAAEVPEAAAVEQPVNTMDDIFNAAFPE